MPQNARQIIFLHGVISTFMYIPSSFVYYESSDKCFAQKICQIYSKFTFADVVGDTTFWRIAILCSSRP